MMMMLGRQYSTIKIQFCFHIDTNNGVEPLHPGWRPSISNWQHTRVTVSANGIRFEAIGTYSEKLKDDQNGTDFLARRLQVGSQHAGNATHADKDFVPAVNMPVI
jgi:hypothetical protein